MATETLIQEARDRATLRLVTPGFEVAASRGTTPLKSDSGGLHKLETEWSDCYSGSAADLVAAGLCTVAQLPGQPGNPLTSCTYFDGALLNRYASVPTKDHRYMHISRNGKRFMLSIGLSPAAKDARYVNDVERRHKESGRSSRERSTGKDSRSLLTVHLTAFRTAVEKVHTGEYNELRYRLNSPDYEKLEDCFQQIETLLANAQFLASGADVIDLRPSKVDRYD